MQAEDDTNVVKVSLLDHVDRATRNTLLRRFEDQSDPAGRRVLGEVQPRAEHDRGVHVMPARVRNSRNQRGVRSIALVLHRQRIDVSAQCQDWAVAGADITDQAGADVEHLGLEAGNL